MEESMMVKINRGHDEGNKPEPHGVSVKRLVSNFSSYATHKHVVFGTLFQLSNPDDDYPENAWWYNPASDMWQVSQYTNDEVEYGKQFERV